MTAQQINPSDIANKSGDYIRTKINVLNDPYSFPKISRFYKSILKKYISLDPKVLTEFQTHSAKFEFHDTPLYVSEKIDGHGMFFVYYSEKKTQKYSYMCNINRRMIIGLDIIEQASKIIEKYNPEIESAIFFVELFVSPSDDPTNFKARSYAKDVITCLTEPQLHRLGLKFLDVIYFGDRDFQQELFPIRLHILKKIFPKTGRISLSLNKKMTQIEILDYYNQISELGNAEGIVIQHSQRFLTFKVKPIKRIDVVIIGALEQQNDPTLLDVALIAAMTPDGIFQVIGRIGSGLPHETLKDIFSRLEFCSNESEYTAVSRDGRRIRMVRPNLVCQVGFLDVTLEDRYGNPIYKPRIKYDPSSETYKFVTMSRMINLVSQHFDYDMPLRLDKQVNPYDVRLEQIQELSPFPLTPSVPQEELPESMILSRYVFKQKRKVKKFLLWKTNKSSTGNYFEYVITLTDYSAGRSSGELIRQIKGTNSKDQALSLLDDWILSEMLNSKGNGLKRGWQLHKIEGSESQNPFPFNL